MITKDDVQSESLSFWEGSVALDYANARDTPSVQLEKTTRTSKAAMAAPDWLVMVLQPPSDKNGTLQSDVDILRRMRSVLREGGGSDAQAIWWCCLMLLPIFVLLDSFLQLLQTWPGLEKDNFWQLFEAKCPHVIAQLNSSFNIQMTNRNCRYDKKEE